MIHNLKQVKTYLIEEINETPNISDIKECIRIATTENCVVELIWRMKYSGVYKRYIYQNNDPQNVYDRLPQVYGM